MEFPEVDENGLESTHKVVSMTVQEERLGKDRLSLKKHFKKKFKLGRKVDRPRDTPYAAIALGGNLHANFGTGALRGQKGETPSRSGVPVSVSPVEYPANLSDSDSELNAARFTKRSRDGGGFDTPGGTGFGDSNHTKEKELQRQSSAVSSRSSATPPVLPWDQVDWGYKGSGTCRGFPKSGHTVRPDYGDCLLIHITKTDPFLLQSQGEFRSCTTRFSSTSFCLRFCGRP
jgi:hypothetical protein